MPGTNGQPQALRPKGHRYLVLVIRLSILWLCQTHTSFRAVAFLHATLALFWSGFGACAATLHAWFLRLGLFLLQRPVPRCADCVWLVDHTVRLGVHRCLLIVGVSLAHLRSHGFTLNHHDVQVLALEVVTHSDGAVVAQQFADVCARVGEPVQIVSDHGSDLAKGLRLFQAKHPQVVATHDVTHALANLLEATLTSDPRWSTFVQQCVVTRQQLQQSAGSFLVPPAWRSKARYMHVAGHLRWANEILVLLQPGDPVTLAEQLGCRPAAARTWLEEKLGWLRGFAEAVPRWRYCGWVVEQTETIIKQRGLSQQSWWQVLGAVLNEPWPDVQALSFRQRVVEWVRAQGAQVPVGETYLGSTDVLESLFGKYKEKVAQAPNREIGASILMLPVFVTEVTDALIQQALETVSAQDVSDWLGKELGPPARQKKQKVLDMAYELAE